MGATYDGLEKPIPFGMDSIPLGIVMLISCLQPRYLGWLGIRGRGQNGGHSHGLEKPIPHGMDFISFGIKMLIFSHQARYLGFLGRLIPNGQKHLPECYRLRDGQLDQQTDGQTNGPAV